MLDIKLVNIKYDHTGGVTEAEWKATKAGSDGKYKVTGIVNFNPKPSSSTYRDFTILIEEEVINWVKVKINSRLPEIEKAIDKQIDDHRLLVQPTDLNPSWYVDPVKQMSGGYD